MIQIIAGVLTFLLVFVTLNRYGEKLTIKKMALTAILLGLALVMTLFSLNLFFFGGQVVIRFSQLVLIILGASLGPVYGLIGGFGFDVLNLLINPLGAFYLGFTVNNLLVAFLPALVFRYFRKRSQRSAFNFMLFAGFTYTIYIIGVLLLFLSQKSLADLIDMVTYKMIISIISVSIVILLGLLLISYLGKVKSSKLYNLDKALLLLISSAILIEFIIQGILTPIWLYDMAKTPILLSMQIRALKGGLMAFINTFVGYPVYKIITNRIIK